MSAHVARYIAFFEGMTRSSLAGLGDVFTDSAHFIDPFNDARGIANIRRVFEHMYETVETPRFIVTEHVYTDPICYLRWTFTFSTRGRPQKIDGVSRVQFDADGKAAEHIDFWDPSRQLYERIPVLGKILKRVRRQLGAAQIINSTKRSDSSLATER
jgi:hypothetical protein